MGTSRTYENPFLWADYPDPDAIRVGDDFYMVSTSMHLMPGCPILHSTDLVHWRFASYAVSDFKEHPYYDLDGGNRYGRGPWACTFKHRDGKFHVGFNTNDEGFFMCVADRIEGPWTRHRFGRFMHDPGLLFDDDGKVYVAHGKNENVMVTELASDACSAVSEDRHVLKAPDGWNVFEGSHLYKMEGWYYLFNTWGGKKGKQAVSRSRSVYGPYETRLILDSGTPDFPECGLHQGGLVDGPDGSWWFVIFQDRNAVGRVPHLLNVTWVDGWPVLGDRGNLLPEWPQPAFAKPVAAAYPATSDDFSLPRLGLQWQWNHNPDESLVSLEERPSWLRLKTGKVVPSILEARNTLTQRTEGPRCRATVTLDYSCMTEGDHSGLTVFQADCGSVRVVRGAQSALVSMENKGIVVESSGIAPRGIIFLRADVDCLADTASFSFSIDGEAWTPIGDILKIFFKLKHFVGNRFGLFSYATRAPGGYSDFSGFRFERFPPLSQRKESMVE